MRIALRHMFMFGTIVTVACNCGSASVVTQHPTQAPRVLNNLVTQVVVAENLSGDATHAFNVTNPRNGWLFFRITAQTGRSGSVRVSIPGSGAANAGALEAIGYGTSEKRTAESMRFMVKGDHVIHLEMSDADVARFEVRLIPVIVYERMVGSFRAMEGFPEYDYKFLERCGMLDSVNTIGTYDGWQWMGKWQRRGRHAIRISGGVSGLGSEDRAFQQWDSGMVNPGGVDGQIIDEFFPKLKKHFPMWAKAFRRLRQKYPDKLCLLYTAGGADSLRELIEPLADLDFYWTPEEQVYETRKTHEEIVEHGFGRTWITGFQDEGYFPNISEQTVHSIGIFSGPSHGKCNDDVYPDRSWKVLRELHFHELATHPLHKNAAGIDMYQSTLCQEEYLRWMAKLCRHYAIEGSTQRLTSDRYELNHIQNPDFARGFADWALEPAESGSIVLRNLKGYGMKVQGRHGHAGDDLLCMKRNAEKPNVIRQEIRHLEPGRFYSVTMYTADLGNLHERQIHQVGLMVRGRVREHPDETIQSAWRHDAAQEFGNKPTYSNYHRIVFRAQEETAELVISDWRNASVLTGPIAQEMMFNFVQVEPYLMPEDWKDGSGS